MSPRRSAAKRLATHSAGNGVESQSRASLANEREFLRASIEDLEREREAGEVEAEDFAVLHSRYSQRLHEVETAIAAPETAGLASAAPETAVTGTAGLASAAPETAVTGTAGPLGSRLRRALGRRRTRLVVGIASASCFVAAAALLAASLAGVRLPGESATGSVSLSGAQQEQETLARAAVVGSEGQVAEAVQLYDQVLRTDPNQPDALAYGGWLIRLAGLSARNRVVLARGDASVAKAVKVAPGYPDGHALYGVILYEDFGNPKAASVQFRDALRAGASKNLLTSVAPIAAKAFAAAREPLPPSYVTAKASAAAG